MKSLLVTLVCLFSLNAVGQRIADKFDVHTWTPPYTLLIPPGWTTERFPIPIDFAPQIPYKGVEDLRFTPGWSKRASEDYWSYVYLWWLEGNPTINATRLQEYLTAYYTGLVARNSTNKPILSGKITPTTTILKKLKTTVGGSEQYGGTVTMFDYMSQSPITLHCLIHVLPCKEQNRTAVFFELSPQPVEHAVWQKLHALQTQFSCTKK